LWQYRFDGAERIRDFQLAMVTNFEEIDFPGGTSSPTERQQDGHAGWHLLWQYSDVINPHDLGIAMPAVLNAGPVAARISFFAPVSLVFFFTVLLILGAVRDFNLHPMNYFFLAAGCFAFQLLFAYLVDLLPVYVSFSIAALVSLILVGGYLHILGGRRLSLIALPAQFAYMVLFSYSFFFDGISGLTIAVGAIITLAILMVASAKVDWSEKFKRPARMVEPPPLV
jgi:inner membrane protein involved in colicin E2 resistance